jgi:hypothetical protein
VFGDSVQIKPGLLAIEAGGIALLIIGVIAVARSSAFSGLRHITDVIRPGSDAGGSRTPDAHPSRDGSPRRGSPGEPAGEAFTANGMHHDGPVARRFSRSLHRRHAHDSASGGEGR